MEKLEYSFIRSEKDNNIILFINADNSWLEKEIDINLNDNNELVIGVNNKSFISDELEPLLLDSLSFLTTQIIFCDKDANFISDFKLSALKPTSLNKYKP